MNIIETISNYIGKFDMKCSNLEQRLNTNREQVKTIVGTIFYSLSLGTVVLLRLFTKKFSAKPKPITPEDQKTNNIARNTWTSVNKHTTFKNLPFKIGTRIQPTSPPTTETPVLTQPEQKPLVSQPPTQQTQQPAELKNKVEEFKEEEDWSEEETPFELSEYLENLTLDFALLNEVDFQKFLDDKNTIMEKISPLLAKYPEESKIDVTLLLIYLEIHPELNLDSSKIDCAILSYIKNLDSENPSLIGDDFQKLQKDMGKVLQIISSYMSDPINKTEHISTASKQRIALLLTYLTIHPELQLKLGKADDTGDCFYHSIAQELTLKGILQKTTTQAVRTEINDYIVKQLETNKEHWICAEKYKEYRDNVKYTFTKTEQKKAEELENQINTIQIGKPEWGEATIDGKLVSEIFDCNLHILAAQGDLIYTIDIPEKPDENKQTINIAFYGDKEGIKGHFIPLLPNT